MLLPPALGYTCGFAGFFSVFILMIGLNLLLLVKLIILKIKAAEFVKLHLIRSCLILGLLSIYPGLNSDEYEVYILIKNFTSH